MSYNDEYRRTRIFEKAESVFEVGKVIIILFWMPVIVLTILAFVLDWLS
jgi:hypothetical protein